MSRFHSHILSAEKILAAYHGQEPFVFHLKKAFAAHKKYGSRDRKVIASLCYNYFRAGRALGKMDMQEKILKAFFLCTTQPSELLAFFYADLDEKHDWPAGKKIAFLGLEPTALFPWMDHCGDAIDKTLFPLSFLQQPDLFLRIRPGRRDQVLQQLQAAGIVFQSSDHCVRLTNATSLEKLVAINKEAVVQDLNSQEVLGTLPGTLLQAPRKIKAWDCCAASGGKSILLYDLLQGNLELTVSDIRDNILRNLQSRLKEAGVPVHKSFTADLSLPAPVLLNELQDIIICDVPCTGSGTWSRTPEQLYYFDKSSIRKYAERQKKIALNALNNLAPGGCFVYITCSVFMEENEEVVSWLQENAGIRVKQLDYLPGYSLKADSMFVATCSK